jgi:DNA-binding winged helix-turn-helix (wHTH) protein/TolB-like protein
MSHEAKPVYEFGLFRLEVAERRLCRAEEVIPLPPRAFDLLLVLVEQAGHLREKEELLAAVWPDAVIEEVNLANTISLLRKALGEGPHEHRFIETVPRRGYRFVASVQKHEADVAELKIIESTSVSAPNVARQSSTVRWWSGRGGWTFAGLLLLLLGLVSTLSFWPEKSAPVAPTIALNTLAVLPFKPLQPNSGDEHLGIGFADTLITKLGGLRQLIVRPTSAVRKYNHLEQDPLVAGREQQVEAVLDASLQRNGERIRVNVRLLKVGDGATLWTYQCDEEYCADIFVM